MKKLLFLLFLSFCFAASVGVSASEPSATDIRVEVVVPEGAAYAVMDVLDGVEARYRTVANGDVYGEYSCAGYVKAYYAAVYNVNVQNLMDAGPPHPADLFMRVDVPQKGDIIFYATPPNANNHSAIVKSFDGARITLIEQNFKWAQDGGTYTYLNRTVPFPHQGEEYEIWRLKTNDVPPAELPPTETPPTELPPVVTVPSVEIVPTEPSPAPNEPPQITGPPATTETPPGIETLPPIETVPVFNPEPEPIPGSEPIPEPVPAESYEAVVTVGRMAITVNGLDMPIDAPALIENNRTVMPLRFVGYALGLDSGDIVWDEYSRTVTVRNNGSEIICAIDSSVLFVNQNPWQMDCPAFIRNNYTYLPLKFLAEALGVNYEWDEAASSVRFYK